MTIQTTAENIWRNTCMFALQSASAGNKPFKPAALLVAGDLLHPSLGENYWDTSGDCRAAKEQRDALVTEAYASIIRVLEKEGIAAAN